MDADDYFILHSGEDGTRIDGPFDKAELLRRITPDADGTTYYGRIRFAARVPDSSGGFWLAPENTVVIIKGRVVVPQPVVQITKLEVS